MLEIKRPNQKEFTQKVLLELFDDLQVEFSLRVERNLDATITRIWNYTQEYWDNTALFATYLDTALEAKGANQTYRVITPEIVERVFQELEGISDEA